MDNRIPNIIKDFEKTNLNKSEIDFLSFNDWLSENNNVQKDWVVFAQSKETEKLESYFITSCLIKVNEQSLNQFLSDSHWFINTEFGIPEKYQKPYENKEYDDGLKAKLNGVIYTPFVFKRYFYGYVPDRFQIIEHFLLYYNCFWVEDKNEYQTINDKGEIKTVIKHIKTQKEETFLIDTHTLKDYLAVKGVYLARFHDHRRQSKNDISDFLKKKFKTFELSNTMSFFELDLRTDIQYDNIKSTSRLLGKDIVKPYSEAESHECSTEKDQNEFLDFIIGRDENGKEIKSTCQPNKLSSYFEDKGTPHFLTPVYFKRELLQKYYSEPKKYDTSENSIKYLIFWRIEIDLTQENLIQVYLGDIGRNLTYNEQLHWRQFNVVPKGKISGHRYKRDFLAEFASPKIEEAPILHFKQSFERLQKSFISLNGEELFKSLAKDDLHLFTTLHIPVTDEWKELDEQILALAKVTTDSFNYKILTKLTGKKIGDIGMNDKPIKGLLALFYELLSITIENEDYINSLITPFNMIQSLRSSSVAHRKSKDLEKTLKKYNLDKLSNEQKFKTIIVELTRSIESINKELK
ncbi:hypothetical protein [Tenacibaculum singaporense]|uniref:Uncharacterized protein n=1 Tax=Tenacibaculum singaporense TaxID=2358479 RepID=A0A3Q8RRK7_9FLAO|nr:hypothetical protein [Tenacibaculum singaporense]AZJ35621.1 hypothetical protein D6T69_08855 [Tenacibaculum singaporense]